MSVRPRIVRERRDTGGITMDEVGRTIGVANPAYTDCRTLQENVIETSRIASYADRVAGLICGF